MSRLNDIIDYADEFGSIHADDARAELAQLRSALAAAQQRSETAERERDAARAQLETIKIISDEELRRGNSGMWHQVEAEARAGLSSATLTPRRCLTCARDAALDMRETAASFADNFDGDDLGFDLPTSIGSGIRVLPLPAECADCNPLKPESEATR